MELRVSDSVSLNAQLVMTGRGCIIGQSGSGKSFLMGLVAEQLLANGLPFCIVDTEGEYQSLKDASPRVIVVGGENGDVPLDMDLDRLFRSSIANSVPVVLDVSDTVERVDTVYRALTALYGIEEEVRKPYPVLIEEADKFAPQVVRQKINIIEELSVRGRKRGIGLMIATQRPSSISKNVLSQCSYGFIGKLTIENDLNAISQLFSGRGALDEIVNLDTGEFMPFGIGYKERFKVEGRTGRHLGGTPQIGDRFGRDVDINSIISQLKGSPQRPGMPPGRKQSLPGKTIQADSLPFAFTGQQAREYADRVSRKMFGIFGRKVEEADAISQRYIAAAFCTIRIPTGRNREFDEYNVIIGSGPSLIGIRKGITVKRLPADPTKLSPLEERMLKMVKSKNGIGKDALVEEGLLRQKSASSDLRRLSSRSIVTVEDGKVYSDDYRGFYLESVPTATREKVQPEQIEGEAPAKDRAALILKNIYPTCTLLEFEPLFIPIYEISLRNRNKVRVFRIDGLYGKELRYE